MSKNIETGQRSHQQQTPTKIIVERHSVDTEKMETVFKRFPNHNVRYIAVNDGADSIDNTHMDITPFRNIINELILKGTHRKVHFTREAQYRVDKPDYAERTVTEAVVNALIHRDYIALGSEIHIDMYDDRVEIVSLAGMFESAPVQECDINTIRSVRRNPVIADLFHRMKYMERRGSGLRKIIS